MSEDLFSLLPLSDEPVELLTAPRNVSTKRVFIAATRMNDGKTTTCLGLYAAFRKQFKRVAFIKPIGQRFVEVHGHKVDEDSFLLDSVYHVEVPIEAMSPIAIDRTFTRRYIKNPEQALVRITDKLCRAFDRAAYESDVVIIEGTGHAGVGSVFDMSNARVAQILNAKVIIIAGAGIGRSVDEIALNKALFDQLGVEVLGVIMNKAHPEKIDEIREYGSLSLKRLGVPLLGVIPVEKPLSAPNLSQVVEEIGGRWLNGRTHGMNERILRVVIGAMTAKGVVDYLQPGVLIITPGDREDIIFSAIACEGISGKKIVSGIVLTRNIPPHPKLMEMLAQTNIPIVITSDESYHVASKINSMTIKTQPQDSDKFAIINRLIKEHVDLDAIKAAL